MPSANDEIRGLACNVIISSAENHPCLRHYRYDRILKAGDFIVIDTGPALDFRESVLV